MNQVYSIQHYVIKFVSYDRSFKWFSPVSSTNKTGRHDIIKILLKVALNTIMNHSLLRVIVSVPLEDKSFRLPYPLTLPCRIVEYIPILYFTFIFSLFVFASESANIIVLTYRCFHNGPAMCPRSVLIAQGICIGPRQPVASVHILFCG